MSAYSAPTSEAARARRPRRAEGRGGRYAAIAFVSVVAAFSALPFVWPLLASVDARASPYLGLPTLTASHFRTVFTNPDYYHLAINSLIMAGGATVLVLVSSTLGGYALSRFRFPLRRSLMFAILFSRIIPAAATIVPIYVIAGKLNLTESYLGVILVMTAQQLPLALWLMKGFFDTVPLDLEEASWLDGLSRLTSAFRIVLPLAAPGVGATALFTFIECWGDFLTPLILLAGSPDKAPLSIGLFRAFIAHNLVDWGLLAALSMVYMVPAVVLYLLVRRHLLKATLAGGVAK
jgi:multiple sugar transport system permease protein